MSARVGWYVHHHGAGHRTRARVVGERLAERGAAVTVLGSDLGPMPSSLERVDLARDDDGMVADASHADADVGGALHWVPLRHDGLRTRMAQISAWVERARPDVLVADVSVEVTLLTRLHGVPVVLVAQPGDRDDPAHRLALRAASVVLAPWPSSARPAPYLAHHPRVRHVGGISGLAVAGGPGDHAAARDGDAVLLAGALGLDDPAGAAGPAADGRVVDAVRSATPDLRWTAVGGSRWVGPDVLDALLRAAPVVLAHAGQNAVADVAAAGAPTLLVPQHRPYDEQRHLADELHRLGLAGVAPFAHAGGWAEDVDWATEIEAVRARGGAGWMRWETDGAVDRAADVVLDVTLDTGRTHVRTARA